MVKSRVYVAPSFWSLHVTIVIHYCRNKWKASDIMSVAGPS